MRAKITFVCRTDANMPPAYRPLFEADWDDDLPQTAGGASAGEDEATANDGYARKQGRLLVVSTFALALLSGIVTFMSLS